MREKYNKCRRSNNMEELERITSVIDKFLDKKTYQE
jgi:hypothetical protein